MKNNLSFFEASSGRKQFNGPQGTQQRILTLENATCQAQDSLVG